MLFLLGLSLVVWLLIPISFGSGVGLITLGGILLGVGAFLILLAAALFKIRSTTVDPTKAPDKLVTDGLYRLSRNPMYLGMLLILIGFSLVLNSLLGLLFPIVFFWIMNWRVIPSEEKVVEEVFGEEYLVYKCRTRRWI